VAYSFNYITRGWTL